MKRQHQVFVGILFLILLVVASITYEVVQNNKDVLNERTKAVFLGTQEDEAVYLDIDGDKFNLENYLGETMVVNIWASWSPTSKDEISALSNLAKEYTNKGVVFLAVNRGENKEKVLRYLNSYNLNKDNSLTFVIDSEDRLYTSFAGYAMPETLVFNKKGDLLWHFRGSFEEKNLKIILDKELHR